MSRNEVVRWIVLNEIGDDYEDVDQMILRQVAEFGARCGLSIERAEVVYSLAGLIEDEFAKAYLLSCQGPHGTELQGIPPLDVIEEDFTTCFYITKKGMDAKNVMDSLYESDDTWRSYDD